MAAGGVVLSATGGGAVVGVPAIAAGGALTVSGSVGVFKAFDRVMNQQNGGSTGPANKSEGTRRENEAQADLQKQHSDASVQRERSLRNEDGTRAIDSQTGTGRRIDNVVIKDGKVIRSVETTSPSADKAAQIGKENRIREAGGTFIRDKTTGNLIDMKDIPTEIDRRP